LVTKRSNQVTLGTSIKHSPTAEDLPRWGTQQVSQSRTYSSFRQPNSFERQDSAWRQIDDRNRSRNDSHFYNPGKLRTASTDYGMWASKSVGSINIDGISRVRSLGYSPESYESGINLRTAHHISTPTCDLSNLQNKNLSTKERFSNMMEREHQSQGATYSRPENGLPRISVAHALPSTVHWDRNRSSGETSWSSGSWEFPDSRVPPPPGFNSLNDDSDESGSHYNLFDSSSSSDWFDLKR